MKKVLQAEEKLTSAQINAILGILIRQCNMIAQREKNDKAHFPELYDEDYMRGRKHSYTASVLAGFQENADIPDMIVRKHAYGINHWQPELVSESAVVQIYSNNASLNIKEIKQKCSEHNIPDSQTEFIVFQFSLNSEGYLEKVDIVKFDNQANVLSRQQIFKREGKVTQLSA